MSPRFGLMPLACACAGRGRYCMGRKRQIEPNANVTKRRKHFGPKNASRNRIMKIAEKLDRLLQTANGNARRVISRQTIASLLRVIVSGRQLAWARSEQVGSNLNYTSATVAVCARISRDKLIIGIKGAPAYKSSPGRAWRELRPWRPQSQRTQAKFEVWRSSQSRDRMRISIPMAPWVASELLKLPPPKIRWHIGLLSDRSEIFVI